MVRQEYGIDQLKILMCDLNDGLTMGVDRVSQDPLDAAKHGVDDEVGFESLSMSHSSLGYPLEDILLCHLPSIKRLIHLWAWVEMVCLVSPFDCIPVNRALMLSSNSLR
jgi:hypothetical protein